MFMTRQITSRNSTQFGIGMTDDQVRAAAPSAFAVEAHESRSARYAYIPTSDVITGLRNEGFIPTWAGQSRCRDEGKTDYTKHMLRFRKADAVATKGGLFPEIVLVNSHDGTSAYQLFSGLFRMVCTNGLMTGKTYESLRVPHTGDVVGRVIEGSFTVIDDANRAVNAAQEMGGVMLSQGEQSAFATAVHALRFEEGSALGEAIRPDSMLTPRRVEDRASDLFTVLNRAQESTIRGGLRGWARDDQGRQVRRVTTRPVAGIAQNTALNRALWTLAEQMQALKA